MKHYLINRTIDHAGFGWYDPLELLQGYKPVVYADYAETTSSAGDWTGCFVLKYNKRYYLIPFNQENRYPYYGYRLHTGEPIISYPSMPDDPMGDYIDYCKGEQRGYYQYLADNI